jgi:DNA-binding transcriptional LysR family regulator
MNISQLKMTQLKYFLDVAQLGSFTKAAEKNFTSQSNISYAIRELEKVVGLPLFIRRNNELTITQYGKTFLPYVDRAFAELSRGTEVLEQLASPESGDVKMAFSFIFSLSIVPDLLRHIYLTSAKDGININIQPFMLHINQDLHYVEELLLDGTCDLGLTCVRVRDEIESLKIGQVEHVLLLPKNHPLAGEKKLSLHDVEDEPFSLLNGDTDETGNYYRNLFKEQNISPHYLNTGMDWLSLLVEVSAGKCLTIAPKTNFSGYDIVAVELDHPRRMRDIYLAWPTNRKLSTSALYVKKQIVDYFGNDMA